MTVELSGTDAEKIDKLIVAIVELRTEVQLCMGIAALALPLMLGSLTFLAVQSINTGLKLDRTAERLERTARP